tara:strand:+ start:30 stop:371 length:342 start_codon:yes stop_codon:yes gene_type:complete
MSTQATTGVAFSSSQGRSYLVTSTDDEWSRQVSTIGGAQLGFGQTNLLVDNVQITYAAGLCAWRIRNSVSQVTKRVGFGYLVGATGPAPYSGSIPGITIQQDDVLEVFTQAVS